MNPEVLAEDTSRLTIDGQTQTDIPRQPLSAAAQRAYNQRHKAPPALIPHLQVMCGPLLRYDTIDRTRNVYRGACLLVSKSRRQCILNYPFIA